MSHNRHDQSSKPRNRRRRLIVEQLEQRQLLAVVTGILFEDLNNNGTYEPANDAPLRNTTVQVLSNRVSVASIRSDAQGFFQFDTNLLSARGSELAPGFELVTNSGMRFDFVTANNEFSFKRLNDIFMGHVVKDRNLNFEHDLHEIVLGGETVGLDVKGDGTIDLTTVSSVDPATLGMYKFTGVASTDPNLLRLQTTLVPALPNVFQRSHVLSQLTSPLTLNGLTNPQLIMGDPVLEDCTDLAVQPFLFED